MCEGECTGAGCTERVFFWWCAAHATTAFHLDSSFRFLFTSSEGLVMDFVVGDTDFHELLNLPSLWLWWWAEVSRNRMILSIDLFTTNHKLIEITSNLLFDGEGVGHWRSHLVAQLQKKKLFLFQPGNIRWKPLYCIILLTWGRLFTKYVTSTNSRSAFSEPIDSLRLDKTIFTPDHRTYRFSFHRRRFHGSFIAFVPCSPWMSACGTHDTYWYPLFSPAMCDPY